jgi:hypothetical protein
MKERRKKKQIIKQIIKQESNQRTLARVGGVGRIVAMYSKRDQ